MAKAIWQGTVIAESDRVIQLEGKKYFPHTSAKPNYFIESDRHSVCPIKGTANYYHVEVNEIAIKMRPTIFRILIQG